MPAPALVGVFDSGVGGLSVLREIRRQMPGQPVIYFGDQAHVPYGPRPLKQVQSFSESVARFLLGQGARLVVVACNTASAAALRWLRDLLPETPFVGMEPAVKPASEQTRSGVAGVLATPATFQSELYASVVERFAGHTRLLTDTCPGLVEEVEAGRQNGARARAILDAAIQPMLAQGVDTIVLGCTHYPFAIPLIRELAGPGVRVIDPAPAVARQTRRVLEGQGLLAEPGTPPLPPRILTSGDPRQMAELLPMLLGERWPVEGAVWEGLTISLVT